MKHRRCGTVWLGLFLLVCGVAAQARPADKTLTPENRLAIMRTLIYEYATARQPLPASRKVEEALEIDESGKINEEKLLQTLANRGAAIHSGEILQITAIEFKKNLILFEINGGGKKKKKWYQRIRVQGGVQTAGGGPTVRTEPPPPPPGSEPMKLSLVGSWIALTFPQRIPDITPPEVKQRLEGVLDFSRRSAAVPWIETIPEEFRQAIEEQRAIVGMDKEMVLVAKGRPQRKVRETKNGVETEDWIYGYPPFVTFVTFVDDKVVEVKEYD